MSDAPKLSDMPDPMPSLRGSLLQNDPVLRQLTNLIHRLVKNAKTESDLLGITQVSAALNTIRDTTTGVMGLQFTITVLGRTYRVAVTPVVEK